MAGKNCRIQLHFHLIILIRQAIRAVRSRKKTFGLNCSVRPVAGSSLIQFKDLAGKNCCILISKTQLGERVRVNNSSARFILVSERKRSFVYNCGRTKTTKLAGKICPIRPFQQPQSHKRHGPHCRLPRHQVYSISKAAEISAAAKYRRAVEEIARSKI